MEKKFKLMIIIPIVTVLLISIIGVYLFKNTRPLDMELNVNRMGENEQEITNKIYELRTNNGLFHSGLINSDPDFYTTYYATNILNSINKLDHINSNNIQSFLNNFKDSRTGLYSHDIIGNDLRSTSMALYMLDVYNLEAGEAPLLFERWKQKDGFYYVLNDEFNSLDKENKMLYKVEQTSSVLKILKEQGYFKNNYKVKQDYMNKYVDLLSDPTIKNNPYILSIIIDTLKLLGNKPIDLDINLEKTEVITQLSSLNLQLNELEIIKFIIDLEGLSYLYKNHFIELDTNSQSKICDFTSNLLKESSSFNDINLQNSVVKILTNMGLMKSELKEQVYEKLKSMEIEGGIFPFMYEPVGDFHSTLYALKTLKSLNGLDSIKNSSINSILPAFNNRIENIVEESLNNEIPVMDVYDYINVYKILGMKVNNKKDLEKILEQNLRYFRQIDYKNIQDYYFNNRALFLLNSKSNDTPDNLESLYHSALKNKLTTGEGEDPDNLYKLMVIESYALNRGELSTKDAEIIQNILIKYKDFDSDYSLRIYEIGMQTLFEFKHKFPQLELNHTIEKLRRPGGYAISINSSSMDIVSTYRALLISEEFKKLKVSDSNEH